MAQKKFIIDGGFETPYVEIQKRLTMTGNIHHQLTRHMIGSGRNGMERRLRRSGPLYVNGKKVLEDDGPATSLTQMQTTNNRKVQGQVY